MSDETDKGTEEKGKGSSGTDYDRARAHVEEIEIRLGGLFDAVSGGFREMADRMRPLGDAVQEAARERGHMHVERRVGIGSVAEFIDALQTPTRPAPEHSVQQTSTEWTLEATLPGTTLPQIRLDIRPARLTLDTPHHHLTCSLPEGFDEAAMEMAFQSGKLTLKAPIADAGGAQ